MGAAQAAHSLRMGRVDVHGGYFDGAVTQRLIYRLAWHLNSMGSLRPTATRRRWWHECADHRIRVMLSERLRTRKRRPPEAMDLSEAAA